MSPALAGGFLTTAPPGKPQPLYSCWSSKAIRSWAGEGDVSCVQLEVEGFTSGASGGNSCAAPQSCRAQSLVYKPGHRSMLGPQLGLSQLVEQAGPCGVSLLYQGLQMLPCRGWGMCVVRLGQPSPGTCAAFSPPPSRWNALWPAWSRRGCGDLRDRRSGGGQTRTQKTSEGAQRWGRGRVAEDGQTVPSAPIILLLTADRSGKGPAVFGPDGPTVPWPRAQPGAP